VSFALRKPLLVAFIGVALLCACTKRASIISGDVVLDEAIPLVRGDSQDESSRKIPVPAGGVVVAFADERGSEVSLELLVDSGSLVRAENTQKGEGLEIAVADLPDAHVVELRLRGPQNSQSAGTVPVRVEWFSAQQLEDPDIAQRVEAYRAWSAGTNSLTPDQAREAGDGSLRRAIELLETPSAGDATLAATVRAARARMLYELELDPREAAAESQRAANAFAALTPRDRLNEARALRIQAASLQEIAATRDEDEAVKLAADLEARRLYSSLVSPESALDLVGRGRVYNDLGLMDAAAAEFKSAKSNFEKAIGEYRRAKFPAGEGQSTRSLAHLAIRRGDYREAECLFSIALRDLDRIADPDVRATLLINAATADVNLGFTDRAIENLSQARETARLAGLAPAESRALLALGVAYWARGESDQAETYFEQAFAKQTAAADDAGRFATLRARGTLRRDGGNARLALQDHEEALKYIGKDPLANSRAHAEIARDYLALGNRPRALASIRTSLAQGASLAAHPVVRDARLIEADVLMMSRTPSPAQIATAAAIAGDAAREAVNSNDLHREIAARRILARVALARADRSKASAEYERAIELVLRYSRSSANPSLQAATRASQHQLFREHLDARMAEGTDKAYGEALQMLESLRWSNFTRQDGGIDRENAKKLDALLEELGSRNVRFAELKDARAPHPGELAALQAEMATLRTEIDRVRIAGGSSTKTAARPVFRALADNRVQLSFAIGGERTYVWRRSRSGVEAFVLPGTAASLRDAVVRAALIDRLQKPGEYDAAILALSDRLLPAGLVPIDASVEIVADDELALVPFAALRSPGNRTRRFVETNTVEMVASLQSQSVGREHDAKHRWRLVTIQGAREGAPLTARRGSSLFAPLPGAAAEVLAIQQRYQDAGGAAANDYLSLSSDGATIAAVRKAMTEGAEVMHFATHGLASLRQPLASLLLLPDELLTAGHIQEWDGDVGLVFISACETAVGPTRFGEGMPGLQRAFLRAGARNVIATLWPIEDGLAKEFAQQFYAELSAGTEARLALARTQRAWVSSSSGESPQRKERKRVAAWGYVLYSR
jgi:tetratricopeptide (TPR) repeat protein